MRRLSLEALPHQWEFWNDYKDGARLAMVGSLGTGKTRTLIIKDFLLHLYNLRLTGRAFGSMLVEPTYGMVQDILIPTIDDVLNGEMNLGVRVVSPMGRPKMYWPGWMKGAFTLLRSGENPNRLTGSNLSHVGFDEPGQIAFDAYKKGTNRARHPEARCRQSFATGSPEGVDTWFAELFDSPQPPYKTVRARQWHKTMRQYPMQLAETYKHDPGQLASYLDAEFVPMFTGRCYGAFKRDTHWDEKALYNPDLDIILACDFNIDAMRWSCGHETPRELIVFDEIVGGYNEDVSRKAADFCHRYAWQIPRDSLAYQLLAKELGPDNVPTQGTRARHNRAVIVVGDFAGSIRSQTGETSYTAMMQVLGPCFLHVGLDIPDSGNPHIVDRVRAVQWHLSGNGMTVRLHPSCIELTKDFEQNAWDKNQRDVAQTHESPGNQRTHASSNFGYWIMQRHKPSHLYSSAVKAHVSDDMIEEFYAMRDFETDSLHRKEL